MNNQAILYEEHNYHIPYTSIFQISEKDFRLLIEFNNFDDLIDKLTEYLNTIKEELYIKGCILGNSVPLGELMRKSTEISDELKQHTIKWKISREI